MKKRLFLSAAIASLFMFQTCVAQVATETPAATQQETTTPIAGKETPEGEAEKTETSAKAPVPVPVAFEANIAKLTPENSSISFIGRHVTEGDAPDPNERLGGFKDFKGEVHLTEDGTALKAIVMEFNTESVFTPIPDLTKHLQAPDFLNVEEFPAANFTSTEIKAGEEEGQFEITGDFTLMGETQPISMPCKIQMTDEGVVIDSEFNLDRTLFGMNKMTEKVSSMVSIKMNVGIPTPGIDGEEKQAQGRRGGNMADRFKTMDADGDGKLTGDEIPERMQQWLGAMDTDEDGSLTLEEMETAMAKFRARQGGGDDSADEKSDDK